MPYKNKEKQNRYLKKYNKDYYQKAREYIFKRLGGKCNHCGATKNLEVDHRDSSKKEREINDVLGTTKKLEKELDKCQLLCYSCHLEKSRKEGVFKKHTKYLTYKNRTQSVYDWAKECNINRKTLRGRLKRNWSIQQAIETPTRKKYQNKKFKIW